MGRSSSRFGLCLIILGVAASAYAQQPSVQYAEPVRISLKSSAAEFDAYGRRFSLNLTGNERVLQKVAAQGKDLSRYRLLRGSLAGAPGSWVRLTDTPEGVEGAIWDGRELYAVTRHSRIAPYLTTPLSATPDETVVYRLSDARDALPRDFCALSHGAAEAQAPTALDQYNAIVAELGGGVLGPEITRQIEISLIADRAFQEAEFNDPTAAMLARLNIVEGIFSEQVGLLLLATDIRLMPADADPFTKTKGTELLEQLSAYREYTPAVRARGLAHLMTGKDLDGTTAGIAYVRTVCDAKRGVSLSQRSFGTTISALVMAHELGHNLGAEHDGEPGTTCAGTSGGFIMAPSVSGYSTFSQCSLDTMRPVIAQASCVTPAQFADVIVENGVNSVTGEAGIPFTLPFIVRSTGNVGAQNATISVTLPANAALVIDSASSSLGACSFAGLTASCNLGAMAVNDSAQVSVVARSTAAANFNAQARVSADNDRLSSNNNRALAVSLRSGVDAAIAVSSNVDEIAVGAPFDVYVDVSSLRALPVDRATVALNLNQPVTSASLSGGSCVVNASSVSCTLSTEIPSGGSRRLIVQAVGYTPGPVFASAGVSTPGDGDLTNNSATLDAWVQADRDMEIGTAATAIEMGVGLSHEILYTVRSRGTLPTGDVSLRFTVPSTLLAVESLDAGGASCTQANAAQWDCPLGTVAPGSSIDVRLRVHSQGPVTGDLTAVLLTTDDGYAGNNTANVTLRIDHQVDVGVSFASGGLGLEGTSFGGQVTLRSNGRQTATGAVFDISLHTAGVLRSARIHNGAACTLLTATTARCALPNMPRNSQAFVNYTAEFAEPGDYDVSFKVTAPGDTAPANDSLTRAVLVRPYLDAALTGSPALENLFGGQIRENVFTLTTNRRALGTARVIASHADPALRVVSISAPQGDCRVDDELGGVCDFVDLPANSSTSITVGYRVAEGEFEGDAVISVATPDDVVSTNNSLSARVQSAASTDVALRVAASVSGARGDTLAFPLIEVVNGSGKAYSPRLDISLPPEVALVEVSAGNALCSGTSELRCEFSTLAPGSTASVTLTVRAMSGGRFTSQVRAAAANDNDAANNTREVTLDITGASPAVTDAGQKSSGGGGRFEWLALLFLAVFAARAILVRRGRV